MANQTFDLSKKAQTVSCSYPRTSVTVSNKHQQEHQFILKSQIY